MKTLTLEVLLGLCLAAALTGCTQSHAESALADTDTASESQTNAVSALPAVAPVASAVADLPEALQPSPALEDIVRLLRAGVEESVLLTHIRQSKQVFNIGTEEILYLTDLGASGEVINAMMAHDGELAAATTTPTSEPVAMNDATVGDAGTGTTSGETPAEPEVSGPPEEAVTVDYFQDYLAPYGIWVDIPGYGRCWQPTVAVTTAGWMPYADSGRWLYTDYGWYWYSDYTWGWAPFHYGRWFHHSSYGWCWAPGTVWGPSWVTWRVSGEYAGWAPLPPSGYLSISIGVSWSAPYYWYTYVPAYRICHPHPRHHAVSHWYAEHLHKQAAPCNRYAVASDHTIVNRGPEPDQLVSGSEEPISRTRVLRTNSRPPQLRRGETLDGGTGVVHSVQPVRGLTRGESPRTTTASASGPTREVPTSRRTVVNESTDNALVMRGVPRTTSESGSSQPTRRLPSGTQERGSFFSARVPPAAPAEPASSEDIRRSAPRRDQNELSRSPTPVSEPKERTRVALATGTTSRSSVGTPVRSEQPARPSVVERPPAIEPANTRTVRSTPTRTPHSPVTAAPSRTSPTTVRSVPSTMPGNTRSTPGLAPRSTSVGSGRDLPSVRTAPFSAPSRSVPSSVRIDTPVRPPLAPSTRESVSRTPATPTRSVPSAPPTRFSPYSPASSPAHAPPTRTFTTPSQPARSMPSVASPPQVSHQPPAAAAPAPSPSRSAPSAPARDRSAGRSRRD